MYQLLGGMDEEWVDYYSSVLEFNHNTTEWQQVGAMKEERGYHGISTVPANKILDSCIQRK